MAGYGLKVFNAGGGVILDTTDTITRKRYVNIVSSSSAPTYNIPGITGKDQASIILPIGDPTLKIPPNHTVSGDNVIFNWGTLGGSYRAVSTLYFMFLFS